MDKEQLRKKFSAEPDEYYKVRLFVEEGFKRRKCTGCGKYFWTLGDAKKCPDPPCTTYGFIGDPPVKRWKNDYIETWKIIEKFFVKNGHTSVPSYPTVCRWFPGLYFTIASIVAFQRAAGATPVFEFPANPLIIPQVSLRFSDIPNVGVSGRHHTSFIMIGQHSLYDPDEKKGYWKDRCIELDWKLLTEVFKIPKEEVSFVEDVWVGPAAFGYSLEYYVRGLELGNAVFTEFVGSPEKYRVMDKKVIDMGAGHERFLWLLHGTPTSYDSAFGSVIEKLKKKIGYDPLLFEKYAAAAAVLDLSDIDDIEKAKKKIAAGIGIPYARLKSATEQLEAIYAIADHAKTLLYAIADGQLPSNVGGGYNLRVILRRALSAIKEFNLDVDMKEVCAEHAAYLQKLSKHLKENLPHVQEIIAIEEERFEESRKRALGKVGAVLQGERELTEEKMTMLYESHGITPEIIKEVAKAKKIKIVIPQDFYLRLAERHAEEKKTPEGISFDLSGLPATRLLYYEDQNMHEFDAKVLRVIDGKYIVLDTTAFFARAGGQEPDHGLLGGCKVYDLQFFGDVVVHSVENPKFKAGQIVHGIVDWDRRLRIMLHHTATHIVNGAARKVLGNHVWQHGAFKDSDKARLDITHYSALTQEQTGKIEELANKIVKSGIAAKRHVLPREKAERRFGFDIYQGGAVPEAQLRIMEIPNFDVEACGGTHADKLSEVGEIIITSAERIQDGVVRLNYVAGPAAQELRKKCEKILQEVSWIMDVGENKIVEEVKALLERWKKSRKMAEKSLAVSVEDTAREIVEKSKGKPVAVEIVEGGISALKEISRQISDNFELLILLGKNEKAGVWVASKGKYNAGEVAGHICGQLGGKGGGSPLLGQGIGEMKNLEEVAASLRKKYR